MLLQLTMIYVLRTEGSENGHCKGGYEFINMVGTRLAGCHLRSVYSV